ncbi:MAG: hypothetical protein KY439_02005 [Actinobacteria bacterium]|nr:hypothetical protein [Actinomycetota bacterium]
MSHIVIYRSNDGQAVYHQTEGLEEAARHVEWLRNSGQGKDARIFRMQEVPIEVKTYYRVEVAVTEEAPAAAAPAPAPAAPAPAPAANRPSAAPTPTPAPAPAPSPAPVAVKPETAGTGAGAAANGGRFGLFGKG